jgi:hypothetical protein
MKQKENIPMASLEKMEHILFKKKLPIIQDQNVNIENRSPTAGCII